MKRPKVLLADDHLIVVEGLKRLLGDEFELVGVAENGREMISAAKELHPDVIVADISMPQMNGLDALARIKKEDPGVKIVFLTMHSEVAYARRALKEGASGFLLKSSASSELITAIRAALEGKTYITPALAGDVFRTLGQGGAPDPVGSLTPRQKEILQLLAAGRSAKEIAGILDVSARTVEFHKYRMMESLGLANSAELVHFAIRHGIVPI